jgi:Phytochelatin synthase
MSFDAATRDIGSRINFTAVGNPNRRGRAGLPRAGTERRGGSGTNHPEEDGGKLTRKTRYIRGWCAAWNVIVASANIGSTIRWPGPFLPECVRWWQMIASCRKIGYGLVAFLAAVLLAGGLLRAEESRPKLGPNAISIQQSHEYLQNHPALDYWALSPHYLPQNTSSACSLAAITMLVNALRGLPDFDDVPLVTQDNLLEVVDSKQWAMATMEHGPGVTWEEFKHYVRASITAFMVDADIEVFKPQIVSATTIGQLRDLLMQNEQTDRDVVLVYYNQGILTGSWDGPHISPIAAYDAEHRRVLIMDVDRQWYVPYWVSDDKLLEAMLAPAPVSRGVLAGVTGGLIRAILRSPRRG